MAEASIPEEAWNIFSMRVHLDVYSLGNDPVHCARLQEYLRGFKTCLRPVKKARGGPSSAAGTSRNAASSQGNSKWKGMSLPAASVRVIKQEAREKSQAELA